MDWLQQSDVRVIATAIAAQAVPVYEVDFRLPTAILMGPEGEGLAPKLIKMADQVAKIPQLTDFDSYNVSVATGIVLYEAIRQRLILVSG